jgi:integrase
MVFKVAKCFASKCTYRRFDRQPKKDPGTCPNCGAHLRYMVNWFYRFIHRGRTYLKSVAPQKAIAEAALAKKKLEIIEGRFLNKVPETRWDIAKEKFLAFVKTHNASGTYDMYALSLANMDRRFRGKTLNEITSEDLEQHIEERLDKGKVTNATINRDIASLKRLCSWATEQKPKLLESNPVENVKKLKESAGRDRFLSEDEIEDLLRECRTPYLRMIVMIALETGLRRDGCLKLQWRDIDTVNGWIHKAHTKGDKTVHIPLTPTLEAELQAYRARCVVMSRWVIPSLDDPNRPMRDDAGFGFNAACGRAGLRQNARDGKQHTDNFRFHDLRHTFASHFLLRGGDISTLSRILGHSTISMTARYGHINDEHMTRMMDKFDKGRR